MFPLLLNPQILLLFTEDFSTVPVPHSKVTMEPCVNLHMHNIMLMVMLNWVLQVPCPCNRVHQKELSSVGINPERTTQPQALDIHSRKDKTNCLLTPSCHLYTQQSPRRWFFQFPFTLRSHRERHKSTGKRWVSRSPHSRTHLFAGCIEL